MSHWEEKTWDKIIGIGLAGNPGVTAWKANEETGEFEPFAKGSEVIWKGTAMKPREDIYVAGGEYNVAAAGSSDGFVIPLKNPRKTFQLARPCDKELPYVCGGDTCSTLQIATIKYAHVYKVVCINAQTKFAALELYTPSPEARRGAVGAPHQAMLSGPLVVDIIHAAVNMNLLAESDLGVCLTDPEDAQTDTTIKTVASSQLDTKCLSPKRQLEECHKCARVDACNLEEAKLGRVNAAGVKVREAQWRLDAAQYALHHARVQAGLDPGRELAK